MTAPSCMISLRLDRKTRDAIAFVTNRDGIDRSDFVRRAIARAMSDALARCAREHGKDVGRYAVGVVDSPAADLAA